MVLVRDWSTVSDALTTKATLRLVFKDFLDSSATTSGKFLDFGKGKKGKENWSFHVYTKIQAIRIQALHQSICKQQCLLKFNIIS